jgi:hypothetical protein
VGKVPGFAVSMALLCFVCAGGPVKAGERSAALVNSFQSFCVPPPVFAVVDAKATAMQLPVQKDVTAPPRPGESGHVKAWQLLLASGRHELVASEARSAKGNLDSCGIGVDDVDGDDLKQELVKAMTLGEPLRQAPSMDGTQRVTTWKIADDAELYLTDATPMKIPGLYLTLLHQIK